mmetsp:Transcript_1917/g.5601  ORF Transcript_1917/g.5601 Transcript_1917/m.5601 type:complete len:221 (-) Transcript_1917:335-997(-)
MAPYIETFPVPPLQCNCSIIGDTESKEAIVVDPGGNVQKIIDKLDAQGFTCKRVLVTHGHLDHILGATELKEKTGADILMNQNDLSLYEKVSEQCRDFGVPLPKNPLAPPDAFLADGDVVQWAADMTVRCVHCPGHTPGSMAYVFPQHNQCCVGDTLFAGSIGRTNWDGIPSLRGTSDGVQIIASIKSKLLSLGDDMTVVTGHGPTTTIAQEKRRNRFLM